MVYLGIIGFLLTIATMILGGILLLLTTLSVGISGSLIMAYFAYLGAQRAATAAGARITSRYECWRGQGCETKVPEDVGMEKEAEKPVAS